MILEIDHINVHYGAIHALKDVSFNLNQNEIIALIGANGAGKSTSLNTISGLLHPTSGSITYLGEEISSTTPQEIVRKGIIQVPEGRRIFASMSVWENLEIGGYNRRNKAENRERIEAMFERFPRLKERRNQAGGTLSGGEQQMLAIARGLMADPKVLLLDEPSMGLAPLLIKEIFEIIQRLNREEKIPILLVEQNVKLALTVAPHAYVMENGRIVMDDTSEKLKENPDIRDFYLGLTDVGGRKSFREVKHYKRRKRWLT